jgi:hypothetical protein
VARGYCKKVNRVAEERPSALADALFGPDFYFSCVLRGYDEPENGDTYEQLVLAVE